ncbi:MAG: pyruvate kinase, partial [Pseudomonadota bacterium]
SFDLRHVESRVLYEQVFGRLLELDAVREGDLVIFTKGDLAGVQGGTNAMKILRVTRPENDAD